MTLRVRGVDTVSGQEGLASPDENIAAPRGILVGSASSADLGDIVASDGAHELVWDSSAATLNITGVDTAGFPFEITGDVDGLMRVRMTNNSSGTSAEARWDINADVSGITIAHGGSNRTVSGAFGPDTGTMHVGNDATGGINFSAGTSSVHQIGFFQGGTESWRISSSRHIITGSDNSYDIGASGATRPRSGYFGTSLNVGNGITVSTTNGDVIAGNGTQELSWDATNMLLSLRGDTTSSDPSASAGAIYINGDAANRLIRMEYADDTVDTGPVLAGYRTRGTLASKTVTGASDLAIGLSGRFWDGSAYIIGGQILIQSSAAHTGTSSPTEIVFQTTAAASQVATDRWFISSDGHLLGSTDNTYDVGASGATRPRSGYFGTSLNVGNGITVSTDNGDIIAGDGTRELDWDASANSLSLTPASGANTSTLNLGVTSSYGALTIVTNGENSGSPDITISGTDGSNGTATSNMRINGGNQSGTGGGGTIFLTAGNCVNAGSGAGSVFLYTGDNTSNAAFTRGSILFYGANATVGRGAQLSVTAGDGTTEGGPISIVTGDASSGTGGGNLALITGSGTSTGGRLLFYTNGTNLRWEIDGSGIMIGGLEAGSATLTGRDATTAATAGADLSISGGDGNTTGAGGILDLAGGDSASGTPGVVTVNSLPLPSVLATITGVDLTATGDSSLYVVPTGRSAIINSIIIQPTSVTGAAGDAAISAGTNASTYDDIIPNTALTGLDATTETITIDVGGIAHIGAAAEDIRFQVDTADSTATTFDVTVYLIGFLI